MHGGGRMQVKLGGGRGTILKSKGNYSISLGEMYSAPSLHYSLLLFPPSLPPSISPSLSSSATLSLPPIAPRRIQFCSFIPTSSPARFLLFISPLLSSHPHIYHYFSSPHPPGRSPFPSLARPPLLRVSTLQSSPSNPVNSSQ